MRHTLHWATQLYGLFQVVASCFTGGTGISQSHLGAEKKLNASLTTDTRSEVVLTTKVAFGVPRRTSEGL